MRNYKKWGNKNNPFPYFRQFIWILNNNSTKIALVLKK